MAQKGKLALILAVLLVCLCAFCSCNRQEESQPIAAGDAVRLVDGVALDYDNMFFDDFVGGINPDDWFIGKQAWGAAANGGVIPQNVNYTDEGVLVISGNGNYYTANDVSGVGSVKNGSLTGGAIISKFVTGPGRYEVKMKVLPRLGACSAFWTYCFDSNTNGNHEIDIELPGGKDQSGNIGFESVLNTNYITVDMNESQDVNLVEVMGKPIALNDGEWHTFGFDWYTDPEMVVYYIDGVVTAVSDIFVPYVQARLWLGVWFPNNSAFVGSAKFESDVMCVDYVRYTPFLNQPAQSYDPLLTDNQVATLDEYPTMPVSVTDVNKIANGNLEYVLTHSAEGYGWNMDWRNLTSTEKNAMIAELEAQIQAENPELTGAKLRQEAIRQFAVVESQINSVQPEEMCFIQKEVGYNESCGMQINRLGMFEQILEGIHEGFKIDFSVMAKGKGRMVIIFQSATGELSRTVLDIDSDDWKQYSATAVAPAGTTQISLQITSAYATDLFADDFTLYVNKK